MHKLSHLSSDLHVLNISEFSDLSALWHNRLEHLNVKCLEILKKKNLLLRLPCLPPLEHYQQGKQPRERFPKSSQNRSSCLIHFLTISDDKCRKTWARTSSKPKIRPQPSRTFKQWAEKEIGKKIQVLKTDRQENSS